MSPASHFFNVRKPKNSTEKKSVCKSREETPGQVFSPAGKIPRLFSDIRQSYLISFYCMHTVFIAFIACDIAFIAFVPCDCMHLHVISHLFHLSHAIMQAAPYPGTSFVRTISVLHDVHRRRCGGGSGGQG